jgi:hypothetical protein
VITLQTHRQPANDQIEWDTGDLRQYFDPICAARRGFGLHRGRDFTSAVQWVGATAQLRAIRQAAYSDV